MTAATYQEMVQALTKPGEDILASLTPEKCHLWHMVTGVSGEAGELLDAAKKHVISNGKLDIENVIEELGDLEFYLEGVRQYLGVSRDLVLARNSEKLEKRYGEKYSDEASRKRADKTITPFGEAFWRNSAGDLHREDGPASVWGDGSKEWWVNGRRHRKDGPAIERANGDKEWWLNGLHHRNDGPAIERANGDKEWYQKGWRHREDGGPAIELANGYRAWYMNGNLRREDRPVIKHADGTVENLVDGELLEQPQKASVAPKPR
jgi:NTP pyrophosphatase (non-canonical NTP hydrolase)